LLSSSPILLLFPFSIELVGSAHRGHPIRRRRPPMACVVCARACARLLSIRAHHLYLYYHRARLSSSRAYLRFYFRPTDAVKCSRFTTPTTRRNYYYHVRCPLCHFDSTGFSGVGGMDDIITLYAFWLLQKRMDGQNEEGEGKDGRRKSPPSILVHGKKVKKNDDTCFVLLPRKSKMPNKPNKSMMIFEYPDGIHGYHITNNRTPSPMSNLIRYF
jgi:hypothetical protein